MADRPATRNRQPDLGRPTRLTVAAVCLVAVGGSAVWRASRQSADARRRVLVGAGTGDSWPLEPTLTRVVVPDDPGLLDRLLAVLTAADLRGRGGAAFPTATKIASARGRRPVLVVNACDGEPLVAKDAVLIARNPALVVDGASLVARALGARRVLFAAHIGSATQTRLHAVLHRKAARLPEPGVLAVPPRYVSSESSALASLLVGGEVGRW